MADHGTVAGGHEQAWDTSSEPHAEADGQVQAGSSVVREEETAEARRRRKFTVGALEQAAGILGAMSASVLVVGLIGPYVAAFTGASGISPAALVGVAAIALTFAACAGAGAMILKGLSRRADDDGRFAPSSLRRSRLG